MASNRGIFRDPRKVADSCCFADDGIARRAAIDRAVGADLDTVLNNDPANPRRPGESARGHGNAGMAGIDSWLTDAHPWMQEDRARGGQCRHGGNP